MILGEPVLWAIVVLTVVAPEWEVHIDPAPLTLQMQPSSFSQKYVAFSLLMLEPPILLVVHERLPKCATCEREFDKLEKCEYCGKMFCKDDYPNHMAWERRHQGLAEEEGKFWRKRLEAPS
jgi:hypothetical protein